MTTLTGKKPKNTYKDLLQVSNTNAGIDSALRAVEDGEGTASALKLSQTQVSADGNELVLDADADTSITSDTDDQIDIRIGGSDLFKLVAAGVAGDKTLRLIESQTASDSAALDFTTGIDSTYDLFFLVLTDLVPATDGDNLDVRVSVASSFQAGGTDYSYQLDRTSSSDAAGTYSSLNSNAGAGAIRAAMDVGGGAAESLCGIIRFHDPAGAAKYKIFTGDLAHMRASGALRTARFTGAYVGATDAIDGIRFLFAGGNIASGTVALYGLKK